MKRGPDKGPLTIDPGGWLLWENDDPARDWFDAVASAEAFQNKEIFIEEIAKHVPEHAMPFVADFLRRNLKLKKLPKNPRALWFPPTLVAVAGRIVYQLKEEGYTLGDAVDELFLIRPEFRKYLDRQTLYDHCNEQTKLGRFEKKRMKKIITKVRPD